MEPSRHLVKEMFDAISPTYDRVNRLLSIGLDTYWRRQVVKHLPKVESLTLLDCATGTGDQLMALFKSRAKIARAYGLDIAPKMLAIAEAKLKKALPDAPITLIEGSALSLPFDQESLDVVTISFGIRNVIDVEAAITDMHRVLKKGGRLLILEFSLPDHRLIKGCYLFYLRHILPRLGGLISKSPQAYRYLNETIETFPYGGAFLQKMKKAGFSHTAALPLTFGSVTLYIGEK